MQRRLFFRTTWIRATKQSGKTTRLIHACENVCESRICANKRMGYLFGKNYQCVFVSINSKKSLLSLSRSAIKKGLCFLFAI